MHPQKLITEIDWFHRAPICAEKLMDGDVFGQGEIYNYATKWTFFIFSYMPDFWSLLLSHVTDLCLISINSVFLYQGFSHKGELHLRRFNEASVLVS